MKINYLLHIMEQKNTQLMKEKIRIKWLSKGVNAIRSIIGYPGYLNPSRPSPLAYNFLVSKKEQNYENYRLYRI